MTNDKKADTLTLHRAKQYIASARPYCIRHLQAISPRTGQEKTRKTIVFSSSFFPHRSTQRGGSADHSTAKNATCKSCERAKQRCPEEYITGGISQSRSLSVTQSVCPRCSIST